MSTPRLMALSQPKVVNDPSLNNQFANTATDGTKPLWRTTRKLHGEAAHGASGLPTVYPKAVNYHEERFGWRSGFWTMWDTEPTGTKNCIARHEVVDRTSSTPRVVPSLRDAGWDRDPSGLQMTPASGTCGTSIRPHECWDNRGSASWRKTIKDEEKALLKPAKGVKQRTPRSARQPRPPPAKALPKVQFRNTTREIP